MASTRSFLSTHWGLYEVLTDGRQVKQVRTFSHDADPSEIRHSLYDMANATARIGHPHIRKGWLDKGPGGASNLRGEDTFVQVGWNEALDYVAQELERIRASFGNRSIFGGSYGWASAGRFHHAQSQIHRFLNTIGGYVGHVGTYSLGAAHVIIPHIFGCTMHQVLEHETPSWPLIAKHTRLVVMFGGIGRKNAQVNAGGCTIHTTVESLRACRQAGVEFVNVSPHRGDAWEGLDAQWIPVVPNTDTALMLAIAFVLETENLCDRTFLREHVNGYERFRDYLIGTEDGIEKNPGWAESLTGVPAGEIKELSRRMAATRCLISVSWSLQRGAHGEQPYWMAATLAAMLGQIGLPGGGIGFGYGAIDGVGVAIKRVRGLTLPQGTNPVSEFIPVARIADMLLHPGESFRFNGQNLCYPDIRLIYWCGGNPFHHHQDLFRLRKAWQKPDTVIVHEPWWTATAKHADIVLPVTTPLERNDIGRTSSDPYIVAMKAVIEPVGESRSDYAIFSAISKRCGTLSSFTEGRCEMEWLEHLYTGFRNELAEEIALPDFADFWEAGLWRLPIAGPEHSVVGFADFRSDPQASPLGTPSGRIEIFSRTIADFEDPDCPGHPVWIQPEEWLGSEAARRFPLHLVSPQPSDKLHSQLDFGRTSTANKVDRRTVLLLNPEDGAKRSIRDGEVVRVFNDRGACLSTARLSRDIMPGVVLLPTGAWFDPADDDFRGQPLDRHGNPNALTLDKGTSRIAQGSTAHSTLVQVERFTEPLPSIDAFNPPSIGKAAAHRVTHTGSHGE